MPEITVGEPVTHQGAALCAALREHRSVEDNRLLDGLTVDAWSALAEFAIRQRVAPLLHIDSPKGMPPGARATLADRARTSALRMLRYQAEFVSLARALEPLGIRLLVLKGLHLASSVYDRPAMREMNDIDVLVEPNCLSAVAALARQLGYEPVQEVAIPAAIEVWHHLPRFVKPGSGGGLEFHWRLADRGCAPLVAPQDLWDRSEPFPLAPNTRVLAPEDALLHICAHATSSHFFQQGIRPLCDIHALVKKHGERLDWDVVAQRASEWQCERGVALALQLAHHQLGVAIPQRLFDRVAASLPSGSVLSLAVDLIFAPRAADVTEPAGRLMSQGSLADKLRYAWSRVALPDELSAMYPAAANDDTRGRWLRIGRRLWDLGGRYAGSLPRLLTNASSEDRKFIDRRNALAAWLRDDRRT